MPQSLLTGVSHGGTHSVVNPLLGLTLDLARTPRPPPHPSEADSPEDKPRRWEEEFPFSGTLYFPYQTPSLTAAVPAFPSSNSPSVFPMLTRHAFPDTLGQWFSNCESRTLRQTFSSKSTYLHYSS